MRAISWLTDSLHRLTADSPPRRGDRMTVQAARGERVSAQLAVRTIDRGRPTGPSTPPIVTARVSCRSAGGLDVRVRRVGYVPVPHHNTPLIEGHIEGRLPGYVADPLFDEDAVRLWPNETHAFWLTVRVASDCRPGPRRVRLTADFGDLGTRTHELIVEVQPMTVARRRDFPVTNWFYADALLDWYRLAAFEERFWTLARSYLANLADHGQDTIYVPVFTPPLDGVKRPTQLLKVARTGRDRYRFDWSDVRRWVQLAGRCGLRRFEFTHLFTQWGAANAIRVYHGQGCDERLLWPAEAPATGPTYRRFLASFLPELHRFCRAEGILSRSLFHTSDEPHGPEHRANYAKARAMLADLAPWMKVLDALSEIEFARDGLVDMPVPSISTAMQFLAESIPCWTYFCCGPRGRFLQRLMDTPLAKIRMSGWLFYRTAVRGFLHWGGNYWYRRLSRELIDPFAVSDGGSAPGWAYGDTFVVYPGPDGPIDSVRWETFADSLADYSLLQTLGVERDDRLLADLRSYDDFPFSPAWPVAARRKLFARARRRAPSRR